MRGKTGGREASPTSQVPRLSQNGKRRGGLSRDVLHRDVRQRGSLGDRGVMGNMVYMGSRRRRPEALGFFRAGLGLSQEEIDIGY
jgi:hypothetical protein